MKRTRIKFCGMTRVEDAQIAVALGVDAIGLVLTQKSRRFAGLDRAQAIRRSLPPFVTAVALFMDDELAWITEAVQAIKPDLLQFHGAETALECTRYGQRYLKAVAMGQNNDWREVVAAHPRASGFIFDGHAAGGQGGAGQAFDWVRIPADAPRTLILAGGLTCDNVASAIGAVRPYAVDVSSGIESGGMESGGIESGGMPAAPGSKDAQKMRRFVEEVQRACSKG